MRIVVARNQRGCGVAHALADIPVEVQRGDDGRLVAYHLANAAEQVALAVLDVLDDHRAVQVQQHAVDGSHIGQALQKLSLQSPPRVGIHRRRRLGERPQHGRQLEVVFLGARDKSAGARVDAPMGVDDLVTPEEPAAGLRKRLIGRRDGGKRARFVRDGANGNSHVRSLAQACRRTVARNRADRQRAGTCSWWRRLMPTLPSPGPRAALGAICSTSSSVDAVMGNPTD